MVIVNEVRRGTYLDSVALMRMSRSIATLAGVEECGIMMATPANVRILADAGVLGPEGEAASAGDLVIAIRAKDAPTAGTALVAARRLLDQPRTMGTAAASWRPRTLRTALGVDPAANLALISVPGAFAAAEARKAIQRGLNVLLFSDNVALEDEIALKREAQAAGVLMMGPDCGTAIIAGVPLAFANVVPRGDIGIIGASGTGIQEVSSLIANLGGGISHAIGTGGRDLKAEVGGSTTLAALDLLDADPATRHVVIVSKPPAAAVARRVLDRVRRSPKTFTICFVGGADVAAPANARLVTTLEAAAFSAVGQHVPPLPTMAGMHAPRPGLIRGLYAGGTLCAEAQVVLREAGLSAASNIPIPGVAHEADAAGRHTLLDLGDDAYTLGRPHPMIEPGVRDAPLAAALADPATAAVLLDCVLGLGGHPDPAGHLAAALAKRGTYAPLIIASVTGTEEDPQPRSQQVARLCEAGVLVAPSAAAAARLACQAVKAPG
ncbi:MAG: acyl-CoA synthetase FdrA [Hyphomicrobiales bacterium]|nr:acyl-CoA synthetase FdrA [Hyphomicrobiales bacterium]